MTISTATEHAAARPDARLQAGVGLRAAIDIGGDLSPRDVHDLATGRGFLTLGAPAQQRMQASRDLLERMVRERRRVYGVTTGYGPLASHPVTPEHAELLQRNLVYHLCAGVGKPLSAVHTRAMMVARASSLARGYSGISAAVFDALVECINGDLVP